MRHSDAFVYFVFLIYMGSLGLAFAAAHSFSVLGFGEMLLLGVALLSGPLLIAFHLVKESERLVIAAVHIFLAILFHPEVTFKAPLYLDATEQFELLRRLNESGESRWIKADMAYDLARSLKLDAIDRVQSIESILVLGVSAISGSRLLGRRFFLPLSESR